MSKKKNGTPEATEQEVQDVLTALTHEHQSFGDIQAKLPGVPTETLKRTLLDLFTAGRIVKFGTNYRLPDTQPAETPPETPAPVDETLAASNETPKEEPPAPEPTAETPVDATEAAAPGLDEHRAGEDAPAPASQKVEKGKDHEAHIRELTETLCNVIRDRASLESEAKAAASAYRDRIKVLDSRITDIADEIREESTVEEIDHDAGVCIRRHRFSGAIIETRPLAPADRQQQLPFDKPASPPQPIAEEIAAVEVGSYGSDLDGVAFRVQAIAADSVVIEYANGNTFRVPAKEWEQFAPDPEVDQEEYRDEFEEQYAEHAGYEPDADEPDADEPDADEPDADEPDADEPGDDVIAVESRVLMASTKKLLAALERSTQGPRRIAEIRDLVDLSDEALAAALAEAVVRGYVLKEGKARGTTYRLAETL